MPESIGASSRQSPLFQSLVRFSPDERDALAVVGLALLDRINSGEIVINDRTLLDTLYPLQDALHGPSGKLPTALAVFLSTAEGDNHG